jgi:hypothetical protein
MIAEPGLIFGCLENRGLPARIGPYRVLLGVAAQCLALTDPTPTASSASPRPSRRSPRPRSSTRVNRRCQCNRCEMDMSAVGTPGRQRWCSSRDDLRWRAPSPAPNSVSVRSKRPRRRGPGFSSHRATFDSCAVSWTSLTVTTAETAHGYRSPPARCRRLLAVRHRLRVVATLQHNPGRAGNHRSAWPRSLRARPPRRPWGHRPMNARRCAPGMAPGPPLSEMGPVDGASVSAVLHDVRRGSTRERHRSRRR